jgi:tRNA A37 threonylcarbamoyladenosine biosynthesis protein TsaE
MFSPYLTRTLIADSGQRNERIVADSEIPQINTPVVILGDPGSGKTELTKMLERQFGYTRVSGLR